VPIPPDHREYSDRGIAREAGERREGDATNQAAIQREALTRGEADEAIRVILRVKDGAILVPRLALYATILPLLMMLGGGTWYVAAQDTTIRAIPKTVADLEATIKDRVTTLDATVKENKALSVQTDTRLGDIADSNKAAVAAVNEKLARIESQLEFLVRTAPKAAPK
jgi:hypothetical protein